MTRRIIRPFVLLAALFPLHLGGQLLLLGRVVPALLLSPLLAVAAYEAADRAADRWSERQARARSARGAAGGGVSSPIDGDRRRG